MINKNGIIQIENFYESDGMLMNKTKSISYTPEKDEHNSCLIGEGITGFVQGKQYYVELTIVWSGFEDIVEPNFGCWTQGSTYNGTEWNWTGNNPLTNTVGNLKSTLLGASSGTKQISGTFTASDRTGYYLGIRTDYSNGTGKVGFSNIKIIPAEYASGSTPPTQNCILEGTSWRQENSWNIKSSAKGGDLE